jgi:hypothetical protein
MRSIDRAEIQGPSQRPQDVSPHGTDLVSVSVPVDGTIRGSGKEELMKRAILGMSAAAAIALAPLCIPLAQAHADDPCVGITDPDAHQACIDDFLRDIYRRELQQCEASPNHGQIGQVCG